MNSPRQNAASVPEEPAEASPVVQTKVDKLNPWPGLDAYDEASSAFFYGRSTESAELFRLIRLDSLTVIYGKSGLGKTSLLQAGLFPSLRAEHYLPVLVRLDFAEGIENPPLEQVRQRLRQALESAKAEYPATEGYESLWEYLHRKDAEFWSTDNFPLTPVLVFDQFEEVFSRTRGNEKSIEQVLDWLADLIENRIPPELATEAAGARRSRLDLLSQRYRIVLSFREDFLPEVRTWEKKVPSLLRSSLRLEPMSRECAVETVIRSGRPVLGDGEVASSALDILQQNTDTSTKLRARTVLDSSVATSIVDLVGRRGRPGHTTDASDTVIEPVLLSLCCTQLNKRRAAGAHIDKILVDKAGQDILETFYRDALADPKVKGEPDAARFIEEYLIQGDFRGDYPKQEAIDENKLRSEQLAALTDRHRLLRIVHRGDTARIELIHDRLVPVVRASRDIRKAKDDERQKLTRDQDREKRERDERDLRRLRIAITLFGLLAITALGAAGWAVRASREAYKAQVQASKNERIANKALQQISYAFDIRKAALSHDQKKLDELASKLEQNNRIRFAATATDLHYKAGGLEIYKFALFPQPETLPKGEDSVAFITYLAAHPSFQNTLLTGGPASEFVVSYTGWGCLTRIVALTEYDDVKKSPTVTVFDMCKLLGGGWAQE